jgi:hypothetical protein
MYSLLLLEKMYNSILSCGPPNPSALIMKGWKLQGTYNQS